MAFKYLWAVKYVTNLSVLQFKLQRVVSFEYWMFLSAVIWSCGIIITLTECFLIQHQGWKVSGLSAKLRNLSVGSEVEKEKKTTNLLIIPSLYRKTFGLSLLCHRWQACTCCVCIWCVPVSISAVIAQALQTLTESGSENALSLLLRATLLMNSPTPKGPKWWFCSSVFIPHDVTPSRNAVQPAYNYPRYHRYYKVNLEVGGFFNLKK